MRNSGYVGRRQPGTDRRARPDKRAATISVDNFFGELEIHVTLSLHRQSGAPEAIGHDLVRKSEYTISFAARGSAAPSGGAREGQVLAPNALKHRDRSQNCGAPHPGAGTPGFAAAGFSSPLTQAMAKA